MRWSNKPDPHYRMSKRREAISYGHQDVGDRTDTPSGLLEADLRRACRALLIRSRGYEPRPSAARGELNRERGSDWA